MQRKPHTITLAGIEFIIPKVGEGTGKRYEIIHAESGRAVWRQFIQCREAEAWLKANIERVKTHL